MLVRYDEFEIASKIGIMVYNYFYEQYEDEEIAQNKKESISKNIMILIDKLNNEYMDNLDITKDIHTLKHLLLYADLDDISDLCQDLELQERKKIKNIELCQEIIEKIVKY